MPNIPIVSRPLDNVNGFRVQNFDTRVLLVDSGACRDVTLTNDIVKTDVDMYVDGEVNGVGGLDTGALAVDTFYAVYVIGDSTGYQETAAIMSLNFFDGPLLPFGYDMFRRIGVCKTESGSTAIKPMATVGNGLVKRVWWETDRDWET